MNWTQKNIENVKHRLSNGESATPIAKSLNIPVSEFYRLCFLHSINIRQLRGLPEPKVRETDPVKIKMREAEKKAYRKRVEFNRKKRENRMNHIVEMRRNGSTYAEIAEKYRLTIERIRQIIQQYNETADNPLIPEEVNHRRSPSPIVAARREKVAELRRAGLSHQQIAKKMKVSLGVIRQDLETYNRESDNPIPYFVVDKRHRIGDAEKAEIVRLRKSSVSVIEIAAKYEVVASRIYQVLNKAGL
jgi:transposase